ncbi:adenine phosphoribosyltransferase [Streptomyces lunalinharesii]|uniref:Adenine phosphoribosyltransferase n=1 Tax=Streptomyces lunalinharesii TaxID=333384 RepID=A0ABP6ES35_9ACTN
MQQPTTVADELRSALRTFPDFPKPGINFQDFTPVFAQPRLLRRIAESLAAAYDGEFDRVLAVEARGFVLGTTVAAVADRPLALARKKGKLPGPVFSAAYDLAYGTDTLELQQDAFAPGERVLVVDDVLASGGTLAAAAGLVAECRAQLVGFSVVMSLAGLDGAARLAPARVFSLLPDHA